MNNRLLRWGLLAAALLTLGLVLLGMAKFQNHFFSPLTVEIHNPAERPRARVISREEAAQFTDVVNVDFGGILCHQGQPAAVDRETSTVYLSCGLPADATLETLAPELTLGVGGYEIYLVADEFENNLQEAAARGHAFTLLVTDGTKSCVQYRVVLTALPVLRMDGRRAGSDGDGDDLYKGTLCLWSDKTVQMSSGQWHVRGATSKNRDKKSWKLDLTDASGENAPLDLLNLGTDDDWILNAMAMEDTKLREKLFMDLWNELASQTEYNRPMSTGEYVEVVIDGTYRGLYLLQRRIDETYLNLTEDDILLKGLNTYAAATPAEAYGIRFSNVAAEEVYGLIQGMFDRTDFSVLNMDNFLDISLFLAFSSASDNVGNKNVYLLLEPGTEGYRLTMIPWDTDLSFGVTWVDKICYDYGYSLSEYVARREYWTMLKETPEIDSLLAARWLQLRQSLLSQEHIFRVLDAHLAAIQNSGALNRDLEKWGLYHQGADTVEKLYAFIEEKLPLLDAEFEPYL